MADLPDRLDDLADGVSAVGKSAVDGVEAALARADGIFAKGDSAIRTGIFIALGAALVFGVGAAALFSSVGAGITAFVIGAIPAVGLWMLKAAIASVREAPQQLIDLGSGLGPELLTKLKGGDVKSSDVGGTNKSNFSSALAVAQLGRSLSTAVKEAGLASTLISVSPARLAAGGLSVIAPPFFALAGGFMMLLALVF